MELTKFCDGIDVYKDFNKGYKKHKKGNIILAPPGIGKTTFVRNQKGKKKDWIDVDDLFGEKNLNISKCEFGKVKSINKRLMYLRADYMLEQSKMYGYKIIGALYWKYKADAIVIPPLAIHKKFYKLRKDLNPIKIIKIRKTFANHAKKYNIPVFDSIIEATTYLEKL